jgi:hypothetical protein
VILGAVLVLLLAALPRPASPAERTMPVTRGGPLSLAITVSQSFGDTRYRLEARAPDPRDAESLVDIESELTFPLEAPLLGLNARWHPGGAPGRWTLTAAVHADLKDPSDAMTDSDWIGGRKIAYSESHGDLDLLLGEAEARYRLQRGERSSLSLLLHLDGQRAKYHLVGFEGWQASLFSEQRYPVSGKAPVIDYDVTYVSVQVGARHVYELTGVLNAASQVSGGILFASDTDDHLLRGRRSEGDGIGVALLGREAVNLVPRTRWSFGLDGEVRYLYARGDVTQTWYRDKDLPAGTVIADIPYTYKSLQFRVGFSLGVRL